MPPMHRHLQFSLKRVLCCLAIAVLTSIACAAAIHANGGNVRPIVELAACLGVGAVLSIVVPELLQAPQQAERLQRPRWTYWAKVKSVLFTPRRLQFSVRSGLIYLTVICCWLGYCVDRLHRFRHAAAAIVQSGGRVSYESREPFVRVRTVGIARQGGPWDDDAIRRLLPHIHVLDPRRIVVGNLASETVIAEIEAEFPNVELLANRRSRRSGG
jgi:hypothetical protein